jgi:hypothetical protein
MCSTAERVKNLYVIVLFHLLGVFTTCRAPVKTAPAVSLSINMKLVLIKYDIGEFYINKLSSNFNFRLDRTVLTATLYKS